MDIFFLVNGMMNIHRTRDSLKNINDIELSEFIGLLNPFVFNGSKILSGGGDDDEGGGLKYYAKLILKILAWLLFFCFFGPLAPWVLISWYTFRRLYRGYKMYFRQY